VLVKEIENCYSQLGVDKDFNFIINLLGVYKEEYVVASPYGVVVLCWYVGGSLTHFAAPSRGIW